MLRVCASSALKGFVHQEHPGLIDKNPRDLDTLLHPAEELRRVEPFEARKAHQLQELIGGTVPLDLAQAPHLWAKSDVVTHVLPGKPFGLR